MALNADLACGEESNVTIALPRLLCDQLAKAFPYCPVDEQAEAESLQRMVVALLEETEHARRKARTNKSQAVDIVPRRSVGPAIHGGPEGAYERELSTGRWRSVSCTRSKPESKADTENLDPERLSSSSCPDGSVVVDDVKTESKGECPEFQECSPTHAVDLAAACATTKRARAETGRLWDAAESVLRDSDVLADFRRRDALSRAVAEAGFETQRRASTWDMMRSGMDMKTFAEVTRKADGSDGRNVSVGAARRIFEAPSAPEKTCAGSDLHGPPKRRSDGSRRPTGRGGTDGPRAPSEVGLGREKASGMGDFAHRAATLRAESSTGLSRDNSRSFLPPRSNKNGYEGDTSLARPRASLPATFGALKASFGKPIATEAKPTATEGKATEREASSVRTLIQALDGANGGA